MTLKAPYLREVSLDSAEGQERYPFSLPLFRQGFSMELTNVVTILSGENGCGKSTLLEALARNCGFNTMGGSSSHLYGDDSDISRLSKRLVCRWLPKVGRGFFFRAESFFNFSTYVDELSKDHGRVALQPYGGKSLHQMSHGEAFLALFENRIQGKGVYIFDEPEAALSPMRLMRFMAILHDLTKQGTSQIIIATHSPILMSYPECQFLYIEDGRIAPRDYRTTEHYKVTRRFLERPEVYLNEILGDTKS